MSFLRMGDLRESEPVPGFKVRFVHAENMTLGYWNVQAGAVLPAHSHSHEQVSSVIEGQFEMSIEAETKILVSGSVAVIPPNAQHSGRAITDCRIVDAFYPVREDYRDA